MKKFYYLLSSIAVIVLMTVACEKSSFDDSSVELLQSKELLQGKNSGCTTIQSGELLDSSGEVIMTGYNKSNGYNYQSHIVNYTYSDGWKLVMKWNDAWLSNQDCDGDGELDRPLDEDGNQYYFGSGAWLTNHWTLAYTDEEGNDCVYDEFIKIVALPTDAELSNGYWYTVDGVEIGESIWGQFAIIQYIVNDPCGGTQGIQYNSPDHPGLGNL